MAIILHCSLPGSIYGYIFHCPSQVVALLLWERGVHPWCSVWPHGRWPGGLRGSFLSTINTISLLCMSDCLFLLGLRKCKCMRFWLAHSLQLAQTRTVCPSLWYCNERKKGPEASWNSHEQFSSTYPIVSGSFCKTEWERILYTPLVTLKKEQDKNELEEGEN